ncbi:MAG TPA: hypothetical protein VFL14_13205, partial [Xanthomonadales bacterium]|nr:hypothetical protein [Xanthomonadales bacterium]
MPGRGASVVASRGAAMLVALGAAGLAWSTPPFQSEWRVAAYALAFAAMWLVHESRARRGAPVVALLLLALAAWDVAASLVGGDSALDGAVALAAIATCGLLAPQLVSGARFEIPAGASAALAALALFTA